MNVVSTSYFELKFSSDKLEYKYHQSGWGRKEKGIRVDVQIHPSVCY